MTTATGKQPTKKEAFKMERGVKYRDAAKTSVIQVRQIDPELYVPFELLVHV